jgi:hypothetical protein
VKIALTTAEAADSLHDYLARCGCIVRRIDERTLEASAPPRSVAAALGDLELQAYLRVWQELNRELEISIASAAQSDRAPG